jgi:hypothetical protein
MSHNVTRPIDCIVSPPHLLTGEVGPPRLAGEPRYCFLAGFSLTNMYFVFAQFETGLV